MSNVNLCKIYVSRDSFEVMVLPAVERKTSYEVTIPDEGNRRRIVRYRDLMKVNVFEEGEFCYIICKQEDQENAKRKLLSVALERMKSYDKLLLYRLEKSDSFKERLSQFLNMVTGGSK